MTRSTEEAFQDHLRRRSAGSCSPISRRITPCDRKPLIGRDAVRESAERLRLQTPSGSFRYPALACGEYAFLRWRGESDDVVLENDADSFVIRDGRIVMQSIYYTVHSRHRR